MIPSIDKKKQKYYKIVLDAEGYITEIAKVA